MKKQISTDQNEGNINEVLRLLAETPFQLDQLSGELSDKKLHEPLDPGERSFTEGLAHLLNCEARSSEAIYLSLLAKEPTLTRIHPERDLGNLLRYDLMPFEEMLSYFKFRRAVLLKVLTSLKEKQWSRTIREEGKQRKESVYWQARGLALHELEHLQDMERKLNK